MLRARGEPSADAEAETLLTRALEHQPDALDVMAELSEMLDAKGDKVHILTYRQPPTLDSEAIASFFLMGSEPHAFALHVAGKCLSGH